MYLQVSNDDDCLCAKFGDLMFHSCSCLHHNDLCYWVYSICSEGDHISTLRD